MLFKSHLFCFLQEVYKTKKAKTRKIK